VTAPVIFVLMGCAINPWFVQYTVLYLVLYKRSSRKDKCQETCTYEVDCVDNETYLDLTLDVRFGWGQKKRISVRISLNLRRLMTTGGLTKLTLLFRSTS
jgi:hypothetical protein